METHAKKWKQKLRKSRLLSCTKGEENRIEFINRVKSKVSFFYSLIYEVSIYKIGRIIFDPFLIK